MDVFVYCQTHWDREWYRPFQEFRLRLIEVIDKLIDDLLSEKLDSFYFDGQIIALDDYLEIYPEKKELINKLIKEKKIFVGPWYVLADEFLVTGESLIRNLLIGINKSVEYGCDEFTGYLPDAFGHSSEIPKILKSFNIDSAVVWRGVGDEKTEFIWTSNDNSSVIASYLTEGYFVDILNQNSSIQEKSKLIQKTLEKIKQNASEQAILLPLGGDHLATPVDFNKQIEAINTHLNDFKIQSSSLFDYIKKKKDNLPNLSIKKGELRNNCRNFILPGTISTRNYLKKFNNIATWKLNKIAEPLQTCLEDLNLVKSRRAELEYAWKLLIQNHPHDSICGCSVDAVHQEMIPRFNQVNQISEGIIARCLNKLSRMTNKGDIIVYNSSNHNFSGLVQVKSEEKPYDNLLSQYISTISEFPQEILYDIQRVPIQEDIKNYDNYLIWAENIPPCSIKIIDKDYKYSKQPDTIKITKNSIENSLISLNINDNGTIKITDNTTKKVFDNLHFYQDLADKGDTYNYAPLNNDKAINATLVKVQIIENGKLQGTLRLFYEIMIPVSIDIEEEIRSIAEFNHIIIVDATLQASSKRIEFKTTWENTSKDHILKLGFNLKSKIYKTISENNFGLIEREFDPDYNLNENLPALKDCELKINTAPMQRFVWANGLGIITEGLQEYTVEQNNLYITLLRAVGKLSKGAINTRGTPAGPPLDTNESQCIGMQEFRYAICPTEKPEELFKEADEFMGSVISEIGIANNTEIAQNLPVSFLNFNNPNIYLYALKPPQNRQVKGIIARIMNISNNEQEIFIKTATKYNTFIELNSLETPISKRKNITDTLIVKPYELKTLLLQE